MSINKMEAMMKLINLKNAMEACGIEAEMYETNDGDIHLRAALWSCQDGKMLDFGAAAENADGYESIFHYIDPNLEV